MADDAQPDSSPQARSVPPEFAERMRQRRPGYDRIYELILKYENIPPEDRAKMSEGEVARSFVTPMFEALGWEVWPFMTEGRNEAPEGILDLVHRELHIPVEIKKFEDSLGGYTIQSGERWGYLPILRRSTSFTLENLIVMRCCYKPVPSYTLPMAVIVMMCWQRRYFMRGWLSHHYNQLRDLVLNLAKLLEHPV